MIVRLEFILTSEQRKTNNKIDSNQLTLLGAIDMLSIRLFPINTYQYRNARIYFHYFLIQ